MDATVEVIRAVRPDVKIVQQDRCGKGNALAACGFAAVTGDIRLRADADVRRARHARRAHRDRVRHPLPTRTRHSVLDDLRGVLPGDVAAVLAVSAWTGNDTRPLEYTDGELAGAAGERVLQDIAREGLTMAGTRAWLTRQLRQSSNST